MYTILKCGDKELKLRLNTKACEEVEARIGSIIDAVNQRVEETKTVVTILWGALQQYEHGYTMDKVYELIDELVVIEGYGLTEKTNLLWEVVKVSGFFSKEQLANMEKVEKELEEKAKKKENTEQPQK